MMIKIIIIIIIIIIIAIIAIIIIINIIIALHDLYYKIKSINEYVTTAKINEA